MTAELSVRERLNLFVDRVNELRALRLVRAGMPSQYTVTIDGLSQKATYQATEPDEEDLRSFLLLFRQFISSREPVFIHRIIGDCVRFLNDDRRKEQVKIAQEHWKSIFREMDDIQIVVNDKDLSPEYVLDLWINGHYFHNDPDKAQEIRRLVQDPIPVARMQFISVLPSLTNAILYVAEVVTYGLEEGLFQFPPINSVD